MLASAAHTLDFDEVPDAMKSGMNVFVLTTSIGAALPSHQAGIPVIEDRHAKLAAALKDLDVKPLLLDADALDAVLTTTRSIQAARTAAATAADSLSPQLAHAIQATENAWRRMERGYGLLTSAEVAEEMGSIAKNKSEYAASKRKHGELIGIRRRGAILHPGFQFRNGKINPTIPHLIAQSKDLGLPQEELAQWLCSANEAFDGDEPVDHLDDRRAVLDALAADFGAQW